MKSGIYKITHIESEKCYIGSSKNVLNRLKRHKSLLAHKKHHNEYLQNAYNKYGINSFIFDSIFFCFEDDLIFYEQLFMDEHNSYNKKFGFNIRKKADSNKGLFGTKICNIGEKYNRLTLLERCELFAGGVKWKAVCDCGNIIIAVVYDIVNGHTKSCGCYNLEKLKSPRKHGKRYSCEYKIWCKMKEQCYNKNNQVYNAFGGRGIKVCDRWLESFSNFYSDVGDKPDGLILCRKNINGDFSPENCRWDTRSNQACNRRKTKFVKINEKLFPIGRAEKELSLYRGSLNQRAKNFNETLQQACDHFAKKKGIM